MTSTLRKLILNILSGIFVLIGTLSANAQGSQNEWTTERVISSQMKLRYHWLGVNGGFETVTLIEAVQNHRVIKSVAISGQPVFNETITRVAFPDCWDGGCSKKIRILDLSTLSELSPIQFEKESFVAVSWEGEKRLKVEMGRMNFDDKTEIKIYDFN
jgi:hypothetical protein